MARFGCSCGNTLSNSTVPNDIQMHVTKFKDWKTACKDNVQVLDWPEEEVWRCPRCKRLYLFEGVKRTREYVVDEYNMVLPVGTCKCGGEDIEQYIVYTDKELDTLDRDFIQEFPLPERSVWSCKSCQSVYVHDHQTSSVTGYKLHQEV